MTPRLSAIHAYPVKSCAGLDLESATVTARGLDGDRRWMLVDESGRFVTGRQLPATVRLRAQPTAGGLLLTFPGQAPLAVAEPDASAAQVSVVVWKDAVTARHAAQADAWLRQCFARPLRLVHQHDAVQRPLRSDYGRPGDHVSFADGFPLLLVSSAALEALNARVGRPLPMARFRPNLVVSGTAAHAEDGWREVRVGPVLFDVVKPCTRCVFTTVDPDTGHFDDGGEPLRSLLQYRRGADGVTFGQNLIPRSAGVLRVGDTCTVLA